jgi:hypothetical protein
VLIAGVDMRKANATITAANRRSFLTLDRHSLERILPSTPLTNAFMSLPVLNDWVRNVLFRPVTPCVPGSAGRQHVRSIALEPWERPCAHVPIGPQFGPVPSNSPSLPAAMVARRQGNRHGQRSALTKLELLGVHRFEIAETLGDGWASPGNRANANGPDSTAADPSVNFFCWAFGAYYLVLDRLVQWV